MRDWLLANAFFAFIVLVGGGVFLVGAAPIKSLNLGDYEPGALGVWAVATVFITGIICRHALARLKR